MSNMLHSTINKNQVFHPLCEIDFLQDTSNVVPAFMHMRIRFSDGLSMIFPVVLDRERVEIEP